MSRHLPRDPRVWLAADVARCEPSAMPSCQRDRCARYLAELPPFGASMADFNAGRKDLSPPCAHWLSAADARPPVPAPVRRVHPPLGS
ncbi:MAG TPA: hypothetical protein PKE15_00200 [Ottowia sp.]|nr:hypothetical protein [Ottowia sp.]